MTGGVRLAPLYIERSGIRAANNAGGGPQVCWAGEMAPCRPVSSAVLVQRLFVPMSAGTRHLAPAVVMHEEDKET